MATRQLDDIEEAVDELDDAVLQTIEPISDDDLNLPAVSTEWQQPWDRLTGESDFRWGMFKHYRDMGLQRSHRAVVDFVIESGRWEDDDDSEYRRRKRNYVSSEASRFEWARRVFAFDQEQERLYQLARSEAIREMAERHENAIERAISGLMVPIDALTIAMEDPAFIKSLSVKNSSKLIDLANRASRTIPSLMSAERLSRGMPTEITGGKVEHEVVHRVERDHIGEVLAALGQARVIDDGRAGFGPGEVIDAEVVEVHSVPAEGNDD